MDVTFTNHAKLRMKKRGILEHEVLETINYPDMAKESHGKCHFRKDIGRGTIEVCCEKTEKNIKVITIYWI